MSELKPKNTAIKRGRPSRPLQDLYEQKIYIHPDFHSVLDFGCGRGEDIAWLKEQGFKHRVVGWDPYWKSDPLPGQDEKFDVVLLIYVLNILPTIEERSQVILEAWDRVDTGGCLFIATRTQSDIERARKGKRWKKHYDGWITSKARGTFQQGFTNEELKLLTMDLSNVHYLETWRDEIDYAQIKVIK